MQMINLQSAAGACTAVSIRDLQIGFNVEETKEILRTVARQYDEEYRDRPFGDDYYNKSLKKMALVIFFATQHYKAVINHFTEIGFTQATPFIPKLKHPENELAMFWMEASKFIEAIGYEPKYKNTGKE